MTNRILIDVQGYMVQAVFANCDIEVAVIDWDNIKEGDTGLITSNNYGRLWVTDQELDEKIAEANEYITENIERDIEQRR